MEQFSKNFKALDISARKAKLDQITMFLRQQNAPVEAEAFQGVEMLLSVLPALGERASVSGVSAWSEIC
jgi:hypothetical protein